VSGLAAEVRIAARRRGAARALILDIDGTLAPIAPVPDAARVPPAVLTSLRSLVASGWRIAVVSGRPAAQARALVPVDGVTIYGCHGVEREGTGVPRRLLGVGRRVARIARDARRPASRYPGILIERKPVGVAFHDRAATQRTRAAWRRALSAWLAGRDLQGLELLSGKRVLEIRPAGVGKSIVAREWGPARRSRRPDRSVVVIGDDRTDEDLLEAFASRAVTIRVGNARVATAARRRLPSTAAVARFLAALAAPPRHGRAR
jgi:trehalose-phosphatase